jgi:transcriptional regulator with XRE-family HTH domain
MPNKINAGKTSAKTPERFKTLGERLKAVRMAYGDAQLDIAQALKCSRAAVAQWESNDTTPTNEKILAIQKRYGIPLHWLIDNQGPAPVLPQDGSRRRRMKVGGHGNLLAMVPTLHERGDSEAVWSIPQRALHAPLDKMVVVKVGHGSFALVDEAQRTPEGQQGTWLITLNGTTGPLIAAPRLKTNGGGHVVLELVCENSELVVKAEKAKIIGRVIARLVNEKT